MFGRESLMQKAGRLDADAVLVLFLLGGLATLFYYCLPGTDPAAAEAAGKLFSANLQKELLPEPTEQHTYLLSLLVLPVLTVLIVRYNRWSLPVIAGAGLWLGFWGVMLFCDDSWIKVVFTASLADVKMQTLTVLIVAGLLFFLFRHRLKLNGAVILASCAVVGLFFTVGFSIYNPTRMLNYFTHHYEILCYAVSQSAAGYPTLHQYGFYPDYLAPVFTFINLDVRNFNGIMSLLNFVVFMTMLLAFWQFCRNKIVAVVYTLVMVYFSNSTVGILNGNSFDPYFAYYPIRTIVPALSIFGVALYLKYPGRRWILPVLGVISGAGVFWNLDSGITVAVALWGWFVIEFGFSIREKRSSRQPLLTFGAWFLTALVIVWGLLCYRHQMWLTPSVLFKYQKIFAVGGFYMLPVQPLPNAWVFFAAVPVIALVRGIFGRMTSPANLPVRWGMYLGILALGLFSYYMGRSHILVLSTVIYPAMILLFLWLDEALRFAKLRGWRFPGVLMSIPVLTFAGLIFPVYINTLPELFGLVAGNMVAFVKNEPGTLDLKAAVIRNFADGRKINIFGNHQGLLYLQSGCVSPLVNGGEIEIILESDRQRILNELGKAEYPLVINGNNDPDRLQIPESLLKLQYRLVAADPGSGMRFYVPAKEHKSAE